MAPNVTSAAQSSGPEAAVKQQPRAAAQEAKSQIREDVQDEDLDTPEDGDFKADPNENEPEDSVAAGGALDDGDKAIASGNDGGVDADAENEAQAEETE